jgi:hypothetical protein
LVYVEIPSQRHFSESSDFDNARNQMKAARDQHVYPLPADTIQRSHDVDSVLNGRHHVDMISWKARIKRGPRRRQLALNG